jgi:Xaa-Pro dipeptidase
MAALGIPASEFEARRARLAEHLAAQNLTGAVLFDWAYVLYFSGFPFIPTERPIAFVMDAKGKPALFVPRLELEHAQNETGFEAVESYPEYPGRDHPAQVLAGMLRDMGIEARIGADTDGYPWIFGYRGPSLSETTGATVVPVAGKVEDLMQIKSEAEIDLIRESVTWGNLAHRLLQKYTVVGASETEVSLRAGTEATLAMVEALGSNYRSSSMYGEGASAGYRGQIGRAAAIPHALANNITFREGDVLVTGAGAAMWGYNSELERTMVLGTPTKAQADLFGHMLRIQNVALSALRAGVPCSHFDWAVRAYYETHDLNAYWKHHSGHAIGLRYHEGPFLDVGDDTMIEAGMVFTVEPGLYSPDLGGFRHSDTVLVTESGIEMLTYYPRELDDLTLPAH